MNILPSIIFEDDDILVVDKPPHCLSISDRYAPDKFNLYSYFSKKYNELFVIHRLDKETSGVICFAKNANTHKVMNTMFEKRKVDKKYHALVSGIPLQEKGRIELSLSPGRGSRHRVTVSKKGKKSISDYEVKEAFKNHSLLEVAIRTGKMHQVRVHLQAIGHPLLVDKLYGGHESFYLSEIKGRKYKRSAKKIENPLMARVSLHAHHLSFVHPGSGHDVKFNAKWPKDFKATVQQLRKWSK